MATTETPDTRILVGEEARDHLDDRTLTLLTNRVNQRECGEHVGDMCHRVALKVWKLFGDGVISDAVIPRIDPAHRPIEHQKELRDAGQIAVAMEGKKTVGMIGYERLEKSDPETGREVYELRRNAVRREDEGKGIGGKLHRTMFDAVRTKHPDALILVDAENPKVSTMCEKMGFREIPKEDGLRMKSRSEESFANMMRWYSGKQNRFWLYDPMMSGTKEPQAA